MRYIVDTHALVWFFTSDKRLSSRAKQILREAEQGKQELIIPVIVLLEAIDIQEKKKIKFNIEEFFDFIETKENFFVSELGFGEAKEIVKIGKGLDLHDRMIVVAAEMLQAVVLTRDAEIKKFTKTIW